MNSSQHLIRLAQAGDRSALTALMKECVPALRAYLHKNVGTLLRQHLSVSDLEQEVLSRSDHLVRQLKHDSTVGNFQALLFLNAGWVIRNSARKQRRLALGAALGEEQEKLEQRPGSRTSGTVTRADERAWLRAQIQRLPEKLRAVLELKLQGCTDREVSETLDITTYAVRQRFAEASRWLRTQSRGDSPS